MIYYLDGGDETEDPCGKFPNCEGNNLPGTE